MDPVIKKYLEKKSKELSKKQSERMYNYHKKRKGNNKYKPYSRPLLYANAVIKLMKLCNKQRNLNNEILELETAIKTSTLRAKYKKRQTYSNKRGL